MPRTITDILNEWTQIQNDLRRFENDNHQNIDAVRQEVRYKLLREQGINMQSELEVLLKKEYELHIEQRRMSLKMEMIENGMNPKDPIFQHKMELRFYQKELEDFDKAEVEARRKEILQKVILEEEISKEDVVGQLLAKQIVHERALDRLSKEETAIRRGHIKGSPGLKTFVDLRVMIDDKFELDQDALARYEAEFKAKKERGEAIDMNNGYFKFLQRESEIAEEIKTISEAEKQKQNQEKILQEERNKKAAEDAAKEGKQIAEAIEEVTEQLTEQTEKKSSGNFFTRLFRRRKKETPAVTAPVKEDVKQEEVKQEEVKQEEVTQGTEKQGTEKKDPEKQETEKKDPEKKRPEKKTQEKRKRRNGKKKKEQKYQIEFAGKELAPEIRNCGDPKILADYLEKAAGLKPEVQEHLKARILANAKILSLEESRAMIQKNRPPAVKYKDGTILLNKKKDVPTQTTINGCWSAVLSDMLGHFGVELSQEEIRAYRPDLQSGDINKENALMDRLNRDAMNEINDMADLIQRTVPNVAHHHMSLGVGNEKNKEVLRETVADALLNKNSPVAVLYGQHYVSVVGIKDNTLIVQNPAVGYDTKYQKLSIDALFEGCDSKNGMGQVTIDWLEDLKFQKDGTCKNVTEQWKSMGIDCKDREFGKGFGNNYDSHVRGYEFDDDSRIMQGIEETVYLPKMSFAKEKGVAKAKIKEKQKENKEKGILTKEYEEKHNKLLVEDEPEIQTMSLDTFSAL